MHVSPLADASQDCDQMNPTPPHGLYLLAAVPLYHTACTRFGRWPL